MLNIFYFLNRGSEGMLRRRVLGPDEPSPPEDFYSTRPGPLAREPINDTPLRRAERHYRKSLDGIVDFERLDDSGKFVDSGWRFRGRPVFGMRDLSTGFLYCPGALDPEEQCRIAKAALSQYLIPRSPFGGFPSNLDAVWEFPGGFAFGSKALNKRTGLLSPIDEALFRKVRWTTLGYQYNWTTKTYDFGSEPFPIPAELQSLAQEFVGSVGWVAWPYECQAGIVNYYQPRDSLTSHVDRSEPDMRSPLVSLSLGMDAVFVLGREDRESPKVDAIRVRSGDISVLVGPSRLYFHGVPRILPQTNPAWLPDEDKDKVLGLLKDARININLRQVFASAEIK